jgi:hypothetical protein
MGNEMFEPMDITHKPKRYQSDILNSDMQSANTNISGDGYYPVNLTVERVIKFFEERCIDGVTDPQLVRIYVQTSIWLRDYMSRNRKTSE